jgi:hypothetical protein
MRPTSSSRLLGLLLSLLSLRSYHSFAPPPAATRHPLGLSRTVQDRSPAATRHPLGLSRTVQDRWGLVAAAEGRTAEPWAAKKTAGEGQAGNEEADNRRQVASSSAVSFVAASWLLLATLGLAGGSTDAAWADEFAEDADGNYVGVAVSQSFEGEIDAAMKQLDGAKNAGQVLEAMGGMAKAVGINNAEGEMNVFAPSFRRATATQLAELKAKNKNTGMCVRYVERTRRRAVSIILSFSFSLSLSLFISL